jgi:Tfp pilus assembly protein FimV
MFLHLALVARVQALAVGDIVVHSPQGAPFLAEMPLTLEPHERDRGVVVELGSRADYRAEDLTRAAVVERLEFRRFIGARDAIRITSNVPIETPAFDLVLLIRSGQVTIVKTARVVLPAPAATAPQPAANVATPASTAPQKASAAPPRPRKPAAPVATPAWLERLPERYGPVERGMPLYNIVQGFGASNEVLWQTIVLIWQANKAQFTGGNMHGLQYGAYLTIPPNLAEGIATLSKAEAQRLVAEQWEAWQMPQRAVGSRQPHNSSRQEPVVLTREPAPARAAITAAVQESPAAAKKVPIAPAAVVLPAPKPPPTDGAADMQTVSQGLETFLAQRLPPQGEAVQTASFVSAPELQGSLQEFEERLTRRLQEALQQAAALAPEARRGRQAPVVDQQSVLEQWLPASSMVYVLVVENALLLLLAGSIVWRWYRSRP